MIEEEARRLLDEVVPAAPSTKGWAGRAAGRVRRRRVVTGALAAVVAVGVPIGLTVNQQGAGPLEATPLPAESSTAVATETPLPPGEVRYTGLVSLWQHEEQERPNICMGNVLESYPPQCSGPAVEGNFSWDDISHSEDAGLRQSALVRVVGTYDDGVLTLTEPVARADAPPSTQVTGQSHFGPLCTDMLVDADPAMADATSANRLHTQLQQLPVVKTWVSDGVDAFNVLVRGDAADTFAQLRTVWGGELCVEAVDAPTQVELQAAMDRVWAAAPEGTFYGGFGENHPEAVLTFQVVIAPPELVAAVEEAAGPDFEVVLTPVLTPLGAESTASPTGSGPSSPSEAGTDVPGSSTTAPPVAGELRASGAIVQRPGEAPRLCLDGVTYSWIPGCTAPLELVGLDWDTVDRSERDGVFVVDSAVVQGILAEDLSSFTVTQVETPHSWMPTALPPGLPATTAQQDAAVERIRAVLPESRLTVENWVSPGYAEELDFVTVRLAEHDAEVIAAVEDAAGPEVSVRVSTVLTPVGTDPQTLLNFGAWPTETPS